MELEELKEELFAQYLKTKFQVVLNDQRIELELVRVEGDKSSMEKIEGVERFALYFLGPAGVYLPQSTYRMEHEALGPMEIFIVPVGIEDKRYQYEAIFNHMTR